MGRPFVEDARAGLATPEPIRIRAKSRGEVTEVRVLMPHPMESGFRRDRAGGVFPAHYITSVRIVAEDRLVLEATLSPAVSQDPLLFFRFRGGEPGERVRVVWTDNKGLQKAGEALIT